MPQLPSSVSSLPAVFIPLLSPQYQAPLTVSSFNNDAAHIFTGPAPCATTTAITTITTITETTTTMDTATAATIVAPDDTFLIIFTFTPGEVKAMIIATIVGAFGWCLVLIIEIAHLVWKIRTRKV
ncbi:hypothetical protein F4781DRAFT_432271 [Annulohypoxylon bovei var. microspora]|nr:hypothetical protein F4781DRAFT_432271 [Annulohypoxylon bovei var. microspora]